ncbi:MAG TPA: TonB family protein [Pseudobdellovibrionaceae bacterium]|jgi:colicin import membrane protein
MSSKQKSLIQDKDLAAGLKISVGLHVALVAAFSIRAAFFEPEQIDYTAAVRVDIVALPDKRPDHVPPQAPAKQEEAAKAEPKPKTEPTPVGPAQTSKPPPQEVKSKVPKDSEAINLEGKKAQKEALEKLKAMAAIEELKKSMEKEASKKIAGMGEGKMQSNTVKGNILSPGTSLTGLNRLQHDSYLAGLDQQIKQNWFLPQWLSKKPLRTQVRLKIDEKGHILSREITLSSGNSSYDELALETIDKSAPFAPPPEKFVSIVAVNGLLIGFPE